MNARPVRHPQLEATRAANGEISLKLPRRKVWWLNALARLGRISEYRMLTLDKVGSWVWDLCDGEHSVKDLVAMLAEKHQLSRKEAEVSMVAYLRTLAQRGLVALAVEQKPQAGEPKPEASEPKKDSAGKSP